MASSSIVNELIKGRRIFVSHHIGVLIKLAVFVVKNLVQESTRPVILDEQGVLLRYLPLELLDSIQVAANTSEACKGDYLVVFEPKSMRHLEPCIASNILVFTKPRSFYPARYSKVYIKRIGSTGQYLVKSPETGISARIELAENKVILIEKPPGIYGKAYEVLKNAMSDYGELTVKDAIRIISLELNIDRLKARHVFLWLARNSYVRVVRGKLSLV